MTQIHDFQIVLVPSPSALAQSSQSLGQIIELFVFNARVIAQIERLHHRTNIRVGEEDFEGLDDLEPMSLLVRY